jgi:hypothetical protein
MSDGRALRAWLPLDDRSSKKIIAQFYSRMARAPAAQVEGDPYGSPDDLDDDDE